MYLPDRAGFSLQKVSLLGHSMRPWTVTLPYSINNLSALAWFQALFSTSAWIALLIAVGRLRFSRVLTAQLAVIVTALIGTSGHVIYWDNLAQADSIAMSGAALCCAGVIFLFRRALSMTWLAPFSLCIGLVTGGLIRYGLVIPVLIGLVLVYRGFRLRELIFRPVVWLLVSLLVIAVPYVIVTNQNMDQEWGKQSLGAEDVLGRTLQQIGIIKSTPYGQEILSRISTEYSSTPCVNEALAQPLPNGDAMAWWITAYGTCPDGMAQLSQEFTGQYVREVAIRPLRSMWALWPAIAESHKALAVPAPSSVLPNPIMSILIGDTSSGFFLPLTALLLSLLPLLAVTQRRNYLRSQIDPMMLTASAFAGNVVTVMLSPLDTQRVAAPFVVVAAVGSWLMILNAMDSLTPWSTRDRYREDCPSRQS
jgi:hypothetical protein